MPDPPISRKRNPLQAKGLRHGQERRDAPPEAPQRVARIRSYPPLDFFTLLAPTCRFPLSPVCRGLLSPCVARVESPFSACSRASVSQWSVWSLCSPTSSGWIGKTMTCCKCCCGNVDCTEGQEGKCCCGGIYGECCQEGEYCCSGVCEPSPCCSGTCDEDADCSEGCVCVDGECVPGDGCGGPCQWQPVWVGGFWENGWELLSGCNEGCACDEPTVEDVGTEAYPFQETPYETPCSSSSGPLAVEFGPGAELKSLLSYLGITATPSCPCNQRAKVMNERGCDWCEENIDTISGWLEEEAKKRNLPYVHAAGKMLIRLAIRRARKKGNGSV